MSIWGSSLGSVIGAGGTSDTAVADKLRDHKLKDAAEQFEAMFLQEMLKPVQAGGEDGDKDASPGSGTMTSYGTEAVAKAIAKSGGLGIARQIVAKVDLERAQHLRTEVTSTKVQSTGADELK